jgi:hypothetical protein
VFEGDYFMLKTDLFPLLSNIYSEK